MIELAKGINWLEWIEGIDWPNWIHKADTASWIEAIATAITALIALYLLGREQADRRERARDTKSSQARAVRMEKVRQYYRGHVQDEPDEVWDVGLTTTIHNGSSEVMTIRLVKFDATEKAACDHEGGQRFSRVVRMDTRIDPGEEEAVYLKMRMDVENTEEAEANSDSWLEMAASFVFEDAAGNIWVRDRDHRLMNARVPRLLGVHWLQRRSPAIRHRRTIWMLRRF